MNLWMVVAMMPPCYESLSPPPDDWMHWQPGHSHDCDQRQWRRAGEKPAHLTPGVQPLLDGWLAVLYSYVQDKLMGTREDIQTNNIIVIINKACT